MRNHAGRVIADMVEAAVDREADADAGLRPGEERGMRTSSVPAGTPENVTAMFASWCSRFSNETSYFTSGFAAAC